MMTTKIPIKTKQKKQKKNNHVALRVSVRLVSSYLIIKLTYVFKNEKKKKSRNIIIMQHHTHYKSIIKPK